MSDDRIPEWLSAQAAGVPGHPQPLLSSRWMMETEKERTRLTPDQQILCLSDMLS